jgi:hypothetical protein
MGKEKFSMKLPVFQPGRQKNSTPNASCTKSPEADSNFRA